MKRITTYTLALLGLFASAAFADDAAAPTSPAEAQTNDDLPIIATIAAKKKLAPVKAANHLRAGAILHESDLATDGDKAAYEPFIGMELKRAVYAGKVITANDIGMPTLIDRNAIVMLEFERGPLLITTEGRALDAGAVGEMVRVMNLSSKIILTAEVVGPNKVITR
ncbi:flagellar basal body P-ring formation chaperone FlgA [Hyphococcus flavus]|uniref:Flagella basal body P-ring formation protein FlgA n=1 Tax=Hyphococcus flavus TaxID=1866326 RepID=A0AAF0CFX1_9PROT|nr:flagellar basal body P-ring formation chaperone FlgA [Hyphococcus flavus]WDI31543.1 flagellar basal body P-ring formation chaperone FlgA [Hyphococcus flavus]